MQVEHVRIQSYMDERYREFRQGVLVFEGSEAEIRARWARGHYYTHLQAFRAGHFGEYHRATASILTVAAASELALLTGDLARPAPRQTCQHSRCNDGNFRGPLCLYEQRSC